jgi:hypothetical protein
MRRAVNILGWISVTLTIAALVLTMISTYHFAYIKYFDDYYTLQVCLFFTMIIWGIKMFDLRSGVRDIIYTVICFLMAFGSMFFRLMKVY